MRKLIVAACCAALMGSISVASAAQTTGPKGQQTIKAHNPMNSNAKMVKKHKAKKHHVKKSGEMKKM